jgi:Planctomycete cytochrome C.
MLRIALFLPLLSGLAWAQKPDFARDIHPILEARCAGCHTGPKAQGGLALNTRAEILKGGVTGPAVIPGTPSASLLIQRVTGRKPPLMPLGGAALSAAEIRALERWIEDGAIGPETTPATAARPYRWPRAVRRKNRLTKFWPPISGSTPSRRRLP